MVMNYESYYMKDSHREAVRERVLIAPRCHARSFFGEYREMGHHERRLVSEASGIRAG